MPTMASHRGRHGKLAVCRPDGYCCRVYKSVLKPLVCLLVAAQLLLAVPAMAFVQTTSGAAASSPCDDMMDSTAGDHCPCCPDGAGSMKDCLASCTLAAVALPNVQLPARRSAPSLRVEAMPSAPLVALADPPLKPPPIR
jgi:hypothetical protein